MLIDISIVLQNLQFLKDPKRLKIGFQIAMIAQEFNFCFLFRIHDLAPYSGLYCDGPICRLGIGKQYLMVSFVRKLVLLDVLITDDSFYHHNWHCTHVSTAPSTNAPANYRELKFETEAG